MTGAEARKQGTVEPGDHPPGRQLVIGWLGDIQRGVAKWQFGLHEDGRCGATVWVPIRGLKWRHSRPKNVETPLTPERATVLIQGMIELPDPARGPCPRRPRPRGDSA